MTRHAPKSKYLPTRPELAIFASALLGFAIVLVAIRAVSGLPVSPWFETRTKDKEILTATPLAERSDENEAERFGGAR